VSTAERLAAISTWIDAANADRDPEALTWIRVAKVAEECGEAVSALNGATGANPRKGVTNHLAEVAAELLDVALTALAAVEHLTGNVGGSLALLDEKVAVVAARAGVA
jgi:NTP pyrophosphatase (non-canonical NTP hydrolase)